MCADSNRQDEMKETVIKVEEMVAIKSDHKPGTVLVEIKFYEDKLWPPGQIANAKLEKAGRTRTLMSVRKISKDIKIEEKYEKNLSSIELKKLEVVKDKFDEHGKVVTSVCYRKTDNAIEFFNLEDATVELDVGEEKQAHGHCLRCNTEHLKIRSRLIPERCLQSNVFLWEGNTYSCFDIEVRREEHNSNDFRFCRNCADPKLMKIYKDDKEINQYLLCPMHTSSQQIPQHADKLLEPVLIKK